MLNREIVSFRSCVRTRGLVAWWNWISNCAGLPSPFSLLGPGGLGAFSFWSCVVLGGLGELSLFPFGLEELSLFPPPQTSYPTLVGLIGKQNNKCSSLGAPYWSKMFAESFK